MSPPFERDSPIAVLQHWKIMKILEGPREGNLEGDRLELMNWKRDEIVSGKAGIFFIGRKIGGRF